MLYSARLSAPIIHALFGDILLRSWDKGSDPDLERPPGIQVFRSLPRPLSAPSFECFELGLGAVADMGEDTARKFSYVELLVGG